MSKALIRRAKLREELTQAAERAIAAGGLGALKTRELARLLAAEGSLILLAGSTHAPEESLILAAFVAGYPEPFSGTAMGWALAAVEAASVIAIGTAVVWWARARRWPTMTEMMVTLYGSVRLCLLVAGPFAADAGPFAAWWMGDGIQILAIIVSLIAHLAWWRAIQ